MGEVSALCVHPEVAEKLRRACSLAVTPSMVICETTPTTGRDRQVGYVPGVERRGARLRGTLSAG
jgi:hypothetical protein